jgi:hypothetical protein
MSFVVSLDDGSSKSATAAGPASSLTPAATSTPSATLTKGPKTASPVDVGTVSRGPTLDSTNAVVETLVPVVSESTQRSRASSPAAQTPRGSSTIIPSISIAPAPKTASSATTRPSSSISIIIQPTQSSKSSELSETENATNIVPIVPVTSSSKSKSTSSASTPIAGVPNGSPFGAPKGSQESEPSTNGKKSGSTVAGVVGGLSAAVLLGIILFFVWKWKTRGQYRFNKRTSFGPYGNGIDANRGGLLVSSVPPKSGDSMSTSGDSMCKWLFERCHIDVHI